MCRPYTWGMASALPATAVQIGADGQAVRRAALRGAIRCRRTGPRTFELPPGELDYLRSHWSLISTLTRALRTEPNVGLAVLYGSTARGDDRADSDIDVLVDFRDDTAASPSALARRLEAAVGRSVDVARLSRVRSESPLLLTRVVDQGRVLVDRDDTWASLRKARENVARTARRRQSRRRQEAADGLAALLAE